MNPTIVRAIVSDRFGEVLFDSEAPRARRLSSARPPIVRRYAPPPAPVADLGDSSKIVGYLLRAMIAALLVAGGLVSVAIAWGAAS